jgi:peptidyl-tRNA hydrolase, PTH1 family
MFLIIGLGNPEPKYTKTRHNVGFLVVDELTKTQGATWKTKTDLHAEVAETKIILAKPQTYMNDSGKAVAALIHRYHTEPQHLIIISDDVDLAVGTIRTRVEGGSGGHNGLKSIITLLGTQQFCRVRIGVGAHPLNIPLENWVLSTFTKEEQILVDQTIHNAGHIALDITRGKMQEQTVHAPKSSPAS